MEIGSSTSSELVKTSQEFVGVALAKRQQEADGAAALKLLDSATLPPVASSGAGSIIDVYV